MRIYTAHTAPGRAPVLVTEGFSWGALVLGPIWLAAHRAWSFAAIALAAYVVALVLAPGWIVIVPALLMGLFGRDLQRLSLEHRGYVMAHVVAASDVDAGLARLLARRPDLVSDAVLHELRP